MNESKEDIEFVNKEQYINIYDLVKDYSRLIHNQRKEIDSLVKERDFLKSITNNESPDPIFKVWKTEERFYISFLQPVTFQVSFAINLLPDLVDALVKLQNEK